MSVRLDKWLWAARFFKTRGRAKEAIDGGKVHVNGARVKPSRDVAVGDTMKITQGYDELIVVVKGLSDKRQSAPIARELYEETQESQDKRALLAEQRRAAGSQVASEGRPSKKDRRQIHRFRDNNLG